ncbi:Methyltransferase type 11 [Denitrovibrio acetiphilus DSM 12809]|uniref:Methyltransferase type 11 n=1 Tax=Denitrovibrio acetiphilus (strain DSM 12809 / NBRC 114555 / N2460) TaxID=522772 RepID=D4H787_DENA2|nr:methyltransferase domain-containing protein [Denitrovibrio acetiphilus]ADD67886.1 Methyltransferase type 11 [Denitrovibrio acetiphilus DSM 12809]
MKIHIKRSFDASCSTYDSSCDIQRMVAACLAEKLSSGHSNILEIGTGTGVYTDELHKKYPDARTTCVDISQPLLKEAMGKHPDNLYICADGERLPLSCGFDLITGSSTLQWFSNPAESIPDMLKLLKPGGRFGFSIFAKGTFTEMAILNKMTGFGSVYDLRSCDEYIEIMQGYDVEFETKEYVLFYDSVKEFLQKQKGTGATFTGAKKFTSKSSYQKFVELYPELFGEKGKIPVTYNILYMHGRIR